MNQLERFSETISTYRRHGWRLERVLMSSETLVLLGVVEEGAAVIFENAPVEESSLDALWFRRVSHAGREAWELRLVGENPYAILETFEADEAEEDREDVRREMEARLRDYANKS